MTKEENNMRKNTKRKTPRDIRVVTKKPKGITSIEDFICAKKAKPKKSKK